MTHKDIYTKFMIEYDKANVTSSYPSLTEYEVATVLDKAYNALIAQKVTGNNVRRATFESDTKSIADLGPLVITKKLASAGTGVANNSKYAVLPEDLLYFLQGNLKQTLNTLSESYTAYPGKSDPLDGEDTRDLPMKLVSHDTALNFFNSAYNMPWIKQPVCYIENSNIYAVYDPLRVPTFTGDDAFKITYIKRPNTFVKDLDKVNIYANGSKSFFDYDFGTQGTGEAEKTSSASLYEFECNSTVAEELISLAVAFALENVESTRLNSKLNMRGLEA